MEKDNELLSDVIGILKRTGASHKFRELQPEDSDDDLDAETRERIIGLARDEHQSDGVVEIDEGAAISEGSDNGCYVAAWVWVDFAGTELDKDNKCDACGATTCDGEGYDGLCGNCADIKERHQTSDTDREPSAEDD